MKTRLTFALLLFFGILMTGCKQEEKKVKAEKTMTGKKTTEVKVDPDLEENKETGKKGVEQLKKETKLKGKDLQAACPTGDAPM